MEDKKLEKQATQGSIISGIYEIINITNDHSYIGQSVNLDKRKWGHFYSLRKNTHTNRYLQRAYNKYGEENFVFEVLFFCTPEDLTLYEQMFVDEFQPVYNICRECVSSSKGIKHTEEQNKRQSEAMMGRKIPEESRIKMGLAHIGLHHTEEHKKHMSELMTGHVFSDEHNRKVSESKKGGIPWNKGIPRTEEEKEKISRGHIGIHVSEETKQKMSVFQSKRIRRVWDKVISPEGITYTVHNLISFCKEHNLGYNNMYAMMTKRYTQAKGWKLQGKEGEI